MVKKHRAKDNNYSKFELKALYHKLGSLRKVALKIGWSQTSLQRRFQSLGIAILPKKTGQYFKFPSIQKVEKLYRELGSQEKLALYLGCSDPTLRKFFRLHGIQSREKGRSKYQFDKKKLQYLYELYGSIEKVAEYYNCGATTIRSHLRQYNIFIPSSSERSADRRAYVNDNFFSLDNEFSFYWAGFIAADGFILDNSYSRKLGINLSIKDVQHLRQFKRDIVSDSSIKYWSYTTNKYDGTNRSYKLCSIIITSTQIVEDLKRFNIVPRKTTIYNIPKWLMSHTLVHHFIRGLIDGDGCFSQRHSGRSKGKIGFSLIGTVKEVFSVQKILMTKCGLHKTKIQLKGNIPNGIIQYHGQNDVVKIRDFLYKDATIFLKRKFDIAKRAKFK